MVIKKLLLYIFFCSSCLELSTDKKKLASIEVNDSLIIYVQRVMSGATSNSYIEVYTNQKDAALFYSTKYWDYGFKKFEKINDSTIQIHMISEANKYAPFADSIKFLITHSTNNISCVEQKFDL